MKQPGLLVTLTLCISLYVHPGIAQATDAPTSTPAPGVTTGQRIGNIVKAAVTTAFPAVSTILDAILSKTPDPTKSSMKTSDLKSAALSPSVKTAVSAQAQAGAAAAIAPIGQVGAELATVNLFLAPTVTANNNVIIMQVELASKPLDWTETTTNWKVVKAQLDKISKVQDTDLIKVQDAYLRTKLQAIRDTNSDLVIRVDAAVTGKDAAKAAPLLQQLADVLSGMPAIAGYELANFQTDFNSLSAWAKGAGGAPAPSDALHVYTKQLDANPAKLKQ